MLCQNRGTGKPRPSPVKSILIVARCLRVLSAGVVDASDRTRKLAHIHEESSCPEKELIQSAASISATGRVGDVQTLRWPEPLASFSRLRTPYFNRGVLYLRNRCRQSEHTLHNG